MENETAEDDLDFSDSTARSRVVNHGGTQLDLLKARLGSEIVLPSFVVPVSVVQDIGPKILVKS